MSTLNLLMNNDIFPLDKISTIKLYISQFKPNITGIILL